MNEQDKRENHETYFASNAFRFWADVHPEKDVATLNKCKPQKV